MLTSIDLHVFDHLLVFLLGIVMPWRTIPNQKKLKNLTFSTGMKIQLYWGNSLGLWLMAMVVGILWWASGRTLTAIGLWPLFPPLPYPALILIVVFLVLYSLDVFSEVGSSRQRMRTLERWRKDLSFLPKTGLEFRHFIFLSFSAGICEEIVFRGFFVSYFYALLLPLNFPAWTAVLVPAILFGLVHYYQGWKAVMKIVLMAIIFGLIFLWSGSLWWLILLHVGVDLIGGAMSWWMREDLEEEE